MTLHHELEGLAENFYFDDALVKYDDDEPQEEPLLQDHMRHRATQAQAMLASTSESLETVPSTKEKVLAKEEQKTTTLAEGAQLDRAKSTSLVMGLIDKDGSQTIQSQLFHMGFYHNYQRALGHYFFRLIILLKFFEAALLAASVYAAARSFSPKLQQQILFAHPLTRPTAHFCLTSSSLFFAAKSLKEIIHDKGVSFLLRTIFFCDGFLFFLFLCFLLMYLL